MDINNDILNPILQNGILLGLMGSSIAFLLGYIVDSVLSYFHHVSK